MNLSFYVTVCFLVSVYGLSISDGIVHRAEAADDFGHIVHNLPDYVIYPSSDEEVSEAVLLAKSKGCGITVRGTGHTTRGQSQCLRCVVIDMKNMTKVRSVNTSWVEIEAGAPNRVALEALRPFNYTTPAQTDSQTLASGGYLSVTGGLGPATFKASTISDNILQVTVVTGTGAIVTASPSENSELFDAVRLGLGQFGVITAIRFAVVPIPGSLARVYSVYQTLEQYAADLPKALNDTVHNTIPFQQWETYPIFNLPGAGAGTDPRYANYTAPVPDKWVFIQQYVVFYNPGNAPNDTQLLKYFSHLAGSALTSTVGYYDWIYRLDPAFELLKEVGAWYEPHPWFEVSLPLSTAIDFINVTLAKTTLDDLPNYSVQEIIPVRIPRSPGTFQLLPNSLPTDTHYIYFGLLRQVLFGVGITGELWPEAIRLLAVNYGLQANAISVGGKPVVSSTLPVGPKGWRAAFGNARYDTFVTTKELYDPSTLFGLNWGIIVANHSQKCVNSSRLDFYV